MTDASIPQNVSMEDLADLLIDGARYDEAEDVQTALEMNVDVNATDYNGRTGGKFLSFMYSCSLQNTVLLTA